MAKTIDFHIVNFLSIWNFITLVSVMHSILKYGVPYHKNTKKNYCHFWLLLATFGYFWLILATFGYFLLMLATFGYFWLRFGYVLATFG